MTEEKKKNVLPPMLADHFFAKKYKFLDYDEDLDEPMLIPSFVVDDLRRTTTMPATMKLAKNPLPDIKTMTMDEGDVLLCSPGKSGQHLNFEIISMLLAGKAEYADIGKEASWVDIKPMSDIHSQLPRPRVICTHLGLGWLPASFRGPNTKVIFTMRNLKDCAVSGFKHYQNFGLAGIAWEKFLKYFLYSKSVSFGSLFDLYADAYENYRDDPNVLIVWFEDLKQKTRETITRMADHLGVAYSPQLIDEIAAATDIDKMRAGKSDKLKDEEMVPGMSIRKTLVLYRKGQVGDWKNYFTVQQNEEFDRVFAEWNKERQIPMRFE